MFSKIKPYLFIILLLSSLVITYVGVSQASDQTITCSETLGCSDSIGPLFDEKNLAPGDSIIKTVEAVNNYSEDRFFAIEVSKFSDSPLPLSEVLNITIFKKGGVVVYGPKKINQWEADGFIVLSEVVAGGLEEYSFIVSLDDVDNNYQNKTLTFDLSLGFDSLPPTDDSTEDSSADSVTSTTQTLSLAPPAIGGPTTDETFSPVLGLFTQKEKETLGGEIGDSTTDEDWVRDGVVKGVSCDEQNYLWWLPLVIQALITILALWWANKKNLKEWWLVSPVLGLVSQIFHYILGCNCATGIWCPRYWLINLAILLLFLIGYYFWQIKTNRKSLKSH